LSRGPGPVPGTARCPASSEGGSSEGAALSTSGSRPPCRLRRIAPAESLTGASLQPGHLASVLDGVFAAAERLGGQHEVDGAARGGAGAVQPEAARRGAVWEQAFAAAHHHREYEQLVLVNHAGRM